MLTGSIQSHSGDSSRDGNHRVGLRMRLSRRGRRGEGRWCERVVLAEASSVSAQTRQLLRTPSPRASSSTLPPWHTPACISKRKVRWTGWPLLHNFHARKARGGRGTRPRRGQWERGPRSSQEERDEAKEAARHMRRRSPSQPTPLLDEMISRSNRRWLGHLASAPFAADTPTAAAPSVGTHAPCHSHRLGYARGTVDGIGKYRSRFHCAGTPPPSRCFQYICSARPLASRSSSQSCQSRFCRMRGVENGGRRAVPGPR